MLLVQDLDPEYARIYTGHSLFNITKHVTFAFIVQSLFDGTDHNLPNIWIKIIQVTIQISVYTGQIFSIWIAIQIILLHVNWVDAFHCYSCISNKQTYNEL